MKIMNLLKSRSGLGGLVALATLAFAGPASANAPAGSNVAIQFGAGSSVANLTPVATTFCFLYFQQINNASNAGCNIQQGATNWQISAFINTGGAGSFASCGARCVTLN